MSGFNFFRKLAGVIGVKTFSISVRTPPSTIFIKLPLPNLQESRHMAGDLYVAVRHFLFYIWPNVKCWMALIRNISDWLELLTYCHTVSLNFPVSHWRHTLQIGLPLILSECPYFPRLKNSSVSLLSEGIFQSRIPCLKRKNVLD